MTSDRFDPDATLTQMVYGRLLGAVPLVLVYENDRVVTDPERARLLVEGCRCAKPTARAGDVCECGGEVRGYRNKRSER